MRITTPAVTLLRVPWLVECAGLSYLTLIGCKRTAETAMRCIALRPSEVALGALTRIDSFSAGFDCRFAYLKNARLAC